jgi:hypothetical protein
LDLLEMLLLFVNLLLLFFEELAHDL